MGMHLSQYTTVFQEHAVTLEQFLSLNEADLENMKIDKVLEYPSANLSSSIF